MTNISKLEDQVKMVQEVSTTKSSSDNEVRKLTTNVTRSRIVAAVESEDDEVRASEEEKYDEDPPEPIKKSIRRGARPSKRHKMRHNVDDIAERAAFVLDKSLEEQALMYELFEAKKKEQAQKVKVNKYFMKYGKYY